MYFTKKNKYKIYINKMLYIKTNNYLHLFSPCNIITPFDLLLDVTKISGN